MTQQDFTGNYFGLDAPFLYRWMMNYPDAHHVMSAYRDTIRPKDLSAYKRIDPDFMASLLDHSGRAEHYAYLACLPQELIIEGMSGVMPMLPKAQRDMIFQRNKEAQACKKEIVDSAHYLPSLLITAGKHVDWIDKILDDEEVPMLDAARRDFMRFKEQCLSSTPPSSPFKAALSATQRMEDALVRLHAKIEAAPLHDVYGGAQTMIAESRRYAQKKLYPNTRNELAELRNSLSGAEENYKARMSMVIQKLRNAAQKPSRPTNVIYDFHTESPERTEELLAMQGEGSNVVRITHARRARKSTVVDEEHGRS